MCLSVTLVDQDHIGWKSWKTIAWTISQTLWAYSGTLRAPIYRVHRGVIFVIAQLSCFESSSITGGHSSDDGGGSGIGFGGDFQYNSREKSLIRFTHAQESCTRNVHECT